jgi:N-acetylglucosamine-6-sulfatase
MFWAHHRLHAVLAAIVIALGGVGYAVSRPASKPKRELIHTQRSLAAAAVKEVDAHGQASRPNIIFVLTDDLSSNLDQYMPNLLQMQRDGLTFSNYFVSDSLCCPSRSSIFTGDFPHDTHVYNNVGRKGGFGSFYAHNDEDRTFATALQKAGYATAMMGKFLNGYLQSKGSAPVPDTYIPPGWSEWDVAGWGYNEFNYTMNSDGTIEQYGHAPSDYLTDVIAGKGIDFINRSVAARKPFMLELATFAPHSPYVPAPQDASDFPGLKAPRNPNFDVLPTNPPRWLASHKPLTPADIARINEVYRLRAQDVQSVDRMIGAIEETLVTDGITRNTYVVFSSDNGLHLGEYRLTPGKMTAFDIDIHVPLIVTGPGVKPDTTNNNMVENVDLAKTFSAIGGTSLASDGQSLLPLIQGEQVSDWRNAVLVEHDGARLRRNDPDFQQPSGGNPTSYQAMRTPDFLYVLYDDGETEFYNLRNDPFELHNIANQLTPGEASLLHSEIERMHHCHGGTQCWAAMHVNLGVVPPANGAPVTYGDAHSRRRRRR